MPFNRIRTIRQFIRGCFKIKADENSKMVVNLWQTESINTVVNIIEGKIKQEESLSWFQQEESN
jgi:hypothetical protein